MSDDEYDPFSALDFIPRQTEPKRKKIEEGSVPRIAKAKLKVKDLTKTKPKKRIIGDKTSDKNQIINWFIKFLQRNKDNFPLDWLRGQKLTFESVNEVRKK